MSEEVTLVKDVPRPENWERNDDQVYCYTHIKTGRTMHEEAYRAKVRKRITLAKYIKEVDEYDG